MPTNICFTCPCLICICMLSDIACCLYMHVFVCICFLYPPFPHACICICVHLFIVNLSLIYVVAFCWPLPLFLIHAPIFYCYMHIPLHLFSVNSLIHACLSLLIYTSLIYICACGWAKPPLICLFFAITIRYIYVYWWLILPTVYMHW